VGKLLLFYAVKRDKNIFADRRDAGAVEPASPAGRRDSLVSLRDISRREKNFINLIDKIRN